MGLGRGKPRHCPAILQIADHVQQCELCHRMLSHFREWALIREYVKACNCLIGNKLERNHPWYCPVAESPRTVTRLKGESDVCVCESLRQCPRRFLAESVHHRCPGNRGHSV